MSTRTTLKQAYTDLACGRLPDEAGRRLVVRAARSFLETPSRARDAMLRQEAIRERDRLLIKLALDHYADLPGVRAKARRILGLGRLYEVSGWRRDEHATTCPAHRIGTPEGALWAVLKAWSQLPGERRLREILSTSKR